MSPHFLMWYLLFFVFLLPEAEARICPADTGPVFLVTEQYTDRYNHCFDYCGKSNCSAVLINPAGCIALTRNDIPPPDSRTIAVHKHCVQHVETTQIVIREANQVLLDHTEKIEKAMDAFHCLSLCTQQIKFMCRSLMFYEESGDCLLNSANSDTAETSKDTDGFKVTYMERRLPGDSPCVSSFAALSTLNARVRGEFRKGESKTWEQCIASCNDCDKAIFGKECLLLDESKDGRIVDVSTQIVFANICKETALPTCSFDESLLVSRRGRTGSEGRECLMRCLNTKDCRYVYRDNDNCQVSPVAMEEKDPIIERVCPGLGSFESGVVFEEYSKCPAGNGERFTGLNLYQCMGLCLSHPTSSCDSISFYDDNAICELLDSTRTPAGNSSVPCQHFTLGIIEEKQMKTKKKLTGRTGKKHSSHSFSVDETAIPNEMLQFSFTADKEKTNLKKRNGEDLSVETICSFSALQVKIKSKSPSYDAHLFLRNGFEKCVTEFKSGKASLQLSLNRSEPCSAEKNGNIYKAVVVIKEKNNDKVPIITAKDKMYTVSCDYSNHNAKLNITRQLQIRDLPYNAMDIGNEKIKPKLVEMELRSKREEMDDSKEEPPPNYPISLGHPLELAIKQSAKQFRILSCVAENHDGNENITLVEDGCPTLTAKDYIVRGSIKRGKRGFILPLRAFKFRQGNLVRISCVLEQCEKCEKPVCSQRSRRNLPNSDAPTEEVHAELLIQENNEKTKVKGKVCLSKRQFLFGGLMWGILFVIEVSVLLYLAWKTQLIQRKFLK